MTKHEEEKHFLMFEYFFDLLLLSGESVIIQITYLNLKVTIKSNNTFWLFLSVFYSLAEK
jgi:hypothetical protein